VSQREALARPALTDVGGTEQAGRMRRARLLADGTDLPQDERRLQPDGDARYAAAGNIYSTSLRRCGA
jgi:hypothetical protein